MNNCRLVYSILDDSSFNSLGVPLILFFSSTIALIVFFSSQKNILLRIIGVIFYVYVIYGFIHGMAESYLYISNLKDIYNSKKYKKVIGTISDYKERKVKDGYFIDTFKVNDVLFEFTNIDKTGGYNRVKSSDGILDNNKTVIIKYLDKNTNNKRNIILGIEICKKLKKGLVNFKTKK